MGLRARGYTLLELLTTLAIVAILCGVALPDAGDALRDKAGEVAIVELARTLSFARSSAVTHASLVTVCRSGNGSTCGAQWQDGALVFTDANGDRVVNASDRILRHARFEAGSGTLRLSSFPNRQYLQYTPEGFTNKQNGSFTWCPTDRAARLAQQLIFTQTGRARLARDNDGDGIREDADGQPLRCD